MSLSAHAQRQVHQQANDLLDRTLPELPPAKRRVLAALLARTAEGAHLFVSRSPSTPVADAFLVARGGISAIVIADRPPDDARSRMVAQHAAERCGGIRVGRDQEMPRSAVDLVLVTPEKSRSSTFRVLAEKDLPTLFAPPTTRLNRAQVRSVADTLAPRLSRFHRLSVSAPDRVADSSGLFDADDLTSDHLAAAQQGSFESWMTFLHPHQHAVVTRDYMGPARISGPAGTGKTVVALHRLRYLARRSVGPLLFTTFVRTLPPVHERSFRRLAPELADRVEFTHLHAWIRRLLSERGCGITVDSRQVNTAFGHAWKAHRDVLEGIEPTPGYWRTEIDRVIKGRGIDTLADYLRVSRRGRALRLDARQREQVWPLYETYQRHLSDRGVLDHNDLVGVAMRELAERPVDVPFAAVMVDEVQDITLNGLRLLQRMAGDGPNRLLLIGDGQQQVYPGGWRLSDAGIPVQGRGEVLRVNYRNRAEVLDFAKRIDATNHVDDLDGAAGVALRQAESVNAGGTVRTWRGSARDLASALTAAIEDLPVPRGQAALIVFQRRDLDRCANALRRAGIPTLQLEHYEGVPDDKLKVGTVHRAKGLDFQAVLVVQFADSLAPASAAGQETRELRERQHLVAATRARDHLWWGVVDAEVPA